MKQDSKDNIEIDLDKSIEKALKKYTLEVDDAIEAHGFKVASYIDYAEDSISELGISIKQQFKETTPSLLFTNLAISLTNTTQNIVNYTINEARSRNTNYFNEKLDKNASELNSTLGKLNARFLNALEQI